ncbi:MAG: sigma-70 family RNA polymerase sigma factor [Acidobacteria bacterium]|nr:sigma-70 family RNA polymerase sigma factor [Acidobacteriota bacterium]
MPAGGRRSEPAAPAAVLSERAKNKMATNLRFAADVFGGKCERGLPPFTKGNDKSELADVCASTRAPFSGRIEPAPGTDRASVRFFLSKRMAHATLNPANPAIPFAASGPGAAVLDSDAALMARVQAGDLDAFEPLVRRYERRLFGYFLNLVEDPAAAADLAQETFIRVSRAAGRYQESGKFESWLFRIAANLVRSRQRRPDQRLPHLSLEEAPAGARELAVRGREARPDGATWRAEVRQALTGAWRL